MTISRRRFLKWAAAAGVGSAAAATADAAHGDFGGYPDSYGVLYDATLCVGCRSCEAACNEVNELPPPDKPFTDLSVFKEKRRTDFKAYTVVNRYDVPGFDKPVYRKIQCNHCLEPACASACFVGAFKKTPEGAVEYDASVCVGCRYCIQACPYGARYMKPDEHVAGKCTFCYHRLVKGKVPACVEVCPTQARVFGELEGRATPLARFMRFNDLQVLKPHLNTKPKAYYANLDYEVS